MERIDAALQKRGEASAGFYESPWGKHPRIQLLTIEDLLGGKSIDYPQATDVTFKKAQRVRPNPSEKQKILPIEGEPPERRLKFRLTLPDQFFGVRKPVFGALNNARS